MSVIDQTKENQRWYSSKANIKYPSLLTLVKRKLELTKPFSNRTLSKEEKCQQIDER